MADATPNRKGPVLARIVVPTRLRKPTSKLVFQQLNFTDIAPSAKTEPTVPKNEPKDEPLLNTSKRRRATQSRVTILDKDEDRIVPKEEKPLIPPSGRASHNVIILLDSDEDSDTHPGPTSIAARGRDTQSDDTDVVKRPKRRNRPKRRDKLRSDPQDVAPDRVEPHTKNAAPRGGGNQMKASLETFLRLISSSAQDEGSCSSLLNEARQAFESVEKKEEKERPQNSHPTRYSRRSERMEQVKAALGPSNTAVGVREYGSFHPLCERSEPKHQKRSTHMVHRSELSAGQGQNAANSHGQPAFETDLPTEWFRPAWSVDREKEKKGDKHKPSSNLGHSLPTLPSDEDEDQITPAASSAKSRDDHTEPHSDEDDNDNAKMPSGPAEEQRRLKISRKKYWRVDPKRTLHKKRKRIERDEVLPDWRSGDIDNIEVPAARIIRGFEEESDVDPDEFEVNRGPSRKQTSQSNANRTEKEREIRAQRRAAEAAGEEVHWSLMADRKPATKENNRNVIIKVRETRGKTQYVFVKPRKEKFRDLREELELLVKLPRDVKFELEYKNQVVKDSDTPKSLGIPYTARFRAKRRVKDDDDSSDGVTEVERKRRREDLLKVTVQDEKGKKHDFQHDKKTKFGSMFHAFARLCQNDVRSYRFFYDGKRLTHDDRPVDCEDFEDGSLIDAFFETLGGTGT